MTVSLPKLPRPRATLAWQSLTATTLAVVNLQLLLCCSPPSHIAAISTSSTTSTARSSTTSRARAVASSEHAILRHVVNSNGKTEVWNEEEPEHSTGMRDHSDNTDSAEDKPNLSDGKQQQEDEKQQQEDAQHQQEDGKQQQKDEKQQQQQEKQQQQDEKQAHSPKLSANLASVTPHSKSSIAGSFADTTGDTTAAPRAGTNTVATSTGGTSTDPRCPAFMQLDGDPISPMLDSPFLKDLHISNDKAMSFLQLGEEDRTPPALRVNGRTIALVLDSDVQSDKAWENLALDSNADTSPSAIDLTKDGTTSDSFSGLSLSSFFDTLTQTMQPMHDLYVSSGSERPSPLPSVFVGTGDISEMWIRDSAAQVWPYLPFARKDKKLQTLIEGVLVRQAVYIEEDVYANSFRKKFEVMEGSDLSELQQSSWQTSNGEVLTRGVVGANLEKTLEEKFGGSNGSAENTGSDSDQHASSHATSMKKGTNAFPGFRKIVEGKFGQTVYVRDKESEGGEGDKEDKGIISLVNEGEKGNEGDNVTGKEEGSKFTDEDGIFRDKFLGRKQLYEERLGHVDARNFELDSGCYFLRLLFHYKTCIKPEFDLRKGPYDFLSTIARLTDLWKVEQRHEEDSKYIYQEQNDNGYSLSRGGKGAPTKSGIGLVWGGYRPSDDLLGLPYNIPQNFFVLSAVDWSKELVKDWSDSTATGADSDQGPQGKNSDQGNSSHVQTLLSDLSNLSHTISEGIEKYGTTEAGDNQRMYCYEVNGLGDCNKMDDANVPSLLAVPYLDYKSASLTAGSTSGTSHHFDPTTYKNTRKFILSSANPYFYQSSSAFSYDMSAEMSNEMALVEKGERFKTDGSSTDTSNESASDSSKNVHTIQAQFSGIGSPHWPGRRNMIWPMSLIIEGLTGEWADRSCKTVRDRKTMLQMVSLAARVSSGELVKAGGGSDAPDFDDASSLLESVHSLYHKGGEFGKSANASKLVVLKRRDHRSFARATTSKRKHQQLHKVARTQVTHKPIIMHESFHVDDPKDFTRPHFGWANALYSELALLEMVDGDDRGDGSREGSGAK